MNIKVQCPCGKGIKFDEAGLGKPQKCPGCAAARVFSDADVIKRYPEEAKEAPKASPPPTPALPAAASNPRRRKKLRILIATGAGAAVLVLLVLVALPTGKKTPAKDLAALPSSSAAKRPAPKGPTPAEKRLQRLLERWTQASQDVSTLSQRPSIWESVIADLESIAVEGKGTEFEAKARRAVETVQAWAATNGLKTVKAPEPVAISAEELIKGLREGFDAGRVGFVMATLRIELGDPKLDPALKERLLREREDFVRKAEQQYSELLAKAKEAAIQDAPGDGRSLLLRALDWEIPPIAERARKDAEGLETLASAARESRAAAALESREKRKRSSIQAHQAIVKALDLIRNGKEKEAARSADEVTDAEAKAAIPELVAAWQSLWLLVERSINSRIGKIKTLRFKEDTVSLPIAKAVQGEVIFSMTGGGEYSRRLRELLPSEVVRSLEYQDRPDPGASSARVLGSDPAIRAARALWSLMDEDYSAAQKWLDEGGLGAPQGKCVKVAADKALAYLDAAGEELLKEALSSHSSGRCGDALRTYQKLIVAPSARERALKGHARCSIEVKAYDAAFEDVERLVSLKHIDDDLLAMMKTSFERCSSSDRVIEALRALHRAEPWKLAVVQTLLTTFRRSHRYAEAEKFLEEKLKERVTDPNMDLVLHAESRIFKEVLSPGWSNSPTQKAGRYLIFSPDAASAKEAAGLLNSVYEEYSRYFPPGRNEEIPLYVRIFYDETSMKLWLEKLPRIREIYEEEREKREPKPPPGSLVTIKMKFPPVSFGPERRTIQYGAFVPELKELVVWKSERMGETLRHEAFHQFLSTYLEDCPIWFNEGFATYFETSRGGLPQDNPLRSREIAEGLGSAPSLKALLTMPLKEFQEHSSVSLLYAEAWSFIYYLAKTKRRWMLDRYFDLLLSGRPASEAFTQSFDSGKTDFKSLEAQWRAAASSQKY